MCFQSQTAAVRQGFMLFSELWGFKMLHLITGTEKRANVKDVAYKTSRLIFLPYQAVVGIEKQSGL